jgi:hypothetical protein
MLADQLGAGGFELVRAFIGCQGGVKLLARQGDVALQRWACGGLGLLLLDLFGEFQRVVVACALDVEPAEQELRFQQVGLGAQGVLQ